MIWEQQRNPRVPKLRVLQCEPVVPLTWVMCVMDLLALAVLVILGFTACAEFGSYALVHPVIRRLPQQQHIDVEQGLLKTFGRLMPVLMALSVILSLLYAMRQLYARAEDVYLASAAAAAFTLSLIVTLSINVPINTATRRWDAATPPADWRQTRDRWEWAQGVRSWLMLVGFVLACLAVTWRL
jgi:hypothetical protein